ncbi:nickel transporter permease [Paenibacillus sp. V4I5]|uniref:nickel transporter permease n=1 Tax=Paenibacillus sp. V4I5 TaxID=3042306 RepID=UPI00278E379B|nr:nickel transporter permease [Paenibacillus sp. V4I5]MDQ0916235.1 ABC-type dipeptide/oligopeptide/nickel transport system permease subunit [Paenibacillus sp. V4I5]
MGERIGLKLHLPKALMISGGCLLILVMIAVLAPHLMPHDPYEVDIIHKLQPPSWDYPLGTDHLGRCVLSRIIAGARVSLTAAFVVIAITLVLSLIIGIAAGYMGGWLDQLLMRICDLFLAFPSLIFALAIVGLLGGGVVNLVVAMVAVHWVGYARMIRMMVVSLKERNYVLSAKITGASGIRIMFQHILPFVLPQIIVLQFLQMGSIILQISELSFLGLGVQAPMAEWGMMINDSKSLMGSHPLLMIAPGMMIFVTVVAFNWFGDTLRDTLDPKLS